MSKNANRGEIELELPSAERSNRNINGWRFFAPKRYVVEPNNIRADFGGQQLAFVSRTSHEKVMTALKRHAGVNNANAIISGRAKRLRSIAAKLIRTTGLGLAGAWSPTHRKGAMDGALGKIKDKATAKTNAGILHCVQDDDVG